MKFYTAGPFLPYENYKDWRDFLIEKVPNHQFIDPRTNNQQSPMFFTREDLESVIKSDGIVLYRPPVGEYIGAAWEHGIACGVNAVSKKNIPTIYIDEMMFPHPILVASAKRTFTKMDAAVVYLKELKNWDKEFEAIYAYIKWEKKYYLKLEG